LEKPPTVKRIIISEGDKDFGPAGVRVFRIGYRGAGRTA
jgi:hypothetical protein